MHKSTEMTYPAKILSPFHCSVGEGSRRTTQGDDSHPRKCLYEKTDVLHPHQRFSPKGMCCPHKIDYWKHPGHFQFSKTSTQTVEPQEGTAGNAVADWNCNNHNLEVTSQPETFRAWQGAFGTRLCVLGLASGGGRAAPSSSPSFGRSVTHAYWLISDSSQQHGFQTKYLFNHLALRWFALDVTWAFLTCISNVTISWIIYLSIPSFMCSSSLFNWRI